MSKIQLLILMTPVVLISLTIHEYSHGYIAHLFGDDTAKSQGRLSLNPLRHLDPIGVLFFYFVGFGWAKPVPVDWRNFHNPRKDMMFVAAAGPLSNLALAIICGFFLRIISPEQNLMLFAFFCFAVYINVALAIFNLIPIFPLDGSSIVKGLLPHNIAAKLTNLDRFGAVILLGVFLMDRFANTGIFSRVLLLPISFMVEFLTQEAYPLLNRVMFISFS